MCLKKQAAFSLESPHAIYPSCIGNSTFVGNIQLCWKQLSWLWQLGGVSCPVTKLSAKYLSKLALNVLHYSSPCFPCKGNSSLGFEVWEGLMKVWMKGNFQFCWCSSILLKKNKSYSNVCIQVNIGAHMNR